MIRKRTNNADGPTVDPLRFVHDDAVGAGRFFGEPGYDTEQAAERAWRRCRRDVWARCRRMQVPGGATAFDGVTFDSFTALWSQISITAVPFDLTTVEAALAADRAALAAFREADPTAAATIADFLAQLDADLDTLHEAALARAAGRVEEAVPLAMAASKYTYGSA